MRKLFVLLTVFGVVISSVFVCFGASGTDATSNDIVYSTLPFDRFHLFGSEDYVDSALIPWAYRDYRPESGGLDGAYQNGMLLVEVIQPVLDTDIYGQVHAYWGEAYNPSQGYGVSIVSFECDQMYLTDTCDLEVGFPSPTTQISQVIIEGEFVDLPMSEWLGLTPEITHFYYDTDDDTEWQYTARVNLGEMLYRYVSSVYSRYAISESSPVYIRNLKINIETVSTGDLPEWTYMEVISGTRTESSFDGLYAKWVASQGVRISSGSGSGSDSDNKYSNDLTAWVTGSISSILELQIAPGFSIDRILYISLIVALIMLCMRIFK